MNKNEKGLKPCPFCGEEKKEELWICDRFYKKHNPIESLHGKRYCYIECQGCEARTQKFWDDDIELEELEEFYKDCKDRAIQMWNMRA